VKKALLSTSTHARHAAHLGLHAEDCHYSRKDLSMPSDPRLLQSLRGGTRGTELQRPQQFRNGYRHPVYFCDPRLPWQREATRTQMDCFAALPKESTFGAIPGPAECNRTNRLTRPRNTLASTASLDVQRTCSFDRFSTADLTLTSVHDIQDLSLRLMQIPGAFIVPAGYRRRRAHQRRRHDGITDLGDEDIWTLFAKQGRHVQLRCGKSDGVVFLQPWIRFMVARGARCSHPGH